MNQYRCETCTKRDQQGYGWCRYANAHVNPPNTISVIAEFTERCGCTLHSDFQNQREKVLDGLDGLRKYANGEYKEADLSDNEHDLRIHLEYENRIWGIMKELRQAGE